MVWKEQSACFKRLKLHNIVHLRIVLGLMAAENRALHLYEAVIVTWAVSRTILFLSWVYGQGGPWKLVNTTWDRKTVTWCHDFKGQGETVKLPKYMVMVVRKNLLPPLTWCVPHLYFCYCTVLSLAYQLCIPTKPCNSGNKICHTCKANVISYNTRVCWTFTVHLPLRNWHCSEKLDWCRLHLWLHTQWSFPYSNLFWGQDRRQPLLSITHPPLTSLSAAL